MPARPVFRFAPSPNGALHLGHARSALVTDAFARRANGRFLLRIEDIDRARCRPEHETAILDDLAWLGLAWEQPVLRQSEHFDVYAAALTRLESMGLVYPCFATRAEIRAAARSHTRMLLDPEGAPRYPGLHRNLPAAEIARRQATGQPYALRLDMARAAARARNLAGGTVDFQSLDARGDPAAARTSCHPERWGDIVLARKDTPASYHLCVVVDDARQGVTHVTRGLDLLAATDVHRVLQLLLGLASPLYHHHGLILAPGGRKLSKSAGDTSLRSLRAAGLTPAEVRARAGFA